MIEHDVTRLDRQARAIRKAVIGIVEDDTLAEFILHLKNPGWTTPAEFLLVAGLLDSLHATVKQVMYLNEVVLAGSREIVEAGVPVG